MKVSSTVALSVIAGIGIGAVAVESLHAQVKPKAYTVTELELIDAAANAAFVPLVQAAQKTAGGRAFRTGGGKIVAMEGEAPKRVVITEWDTLEQAEAFYKSTSLEGSYASTREGGQNNTAVRRRGDELRAVPAPDSDTAAKITTRRDRPMRRPHPMADACFASLYA
jgi:uncharacterized protein (DUF1330 family)